VCKHRLRGTRKQRRVHTASIAFVTPGSIARRRILWSGPRLHIRPPPEAPTDIRKAPRTPTSLTRVVDSDVDATVVRVVGFQWNTRCQCRLRKPPGECAIRHRKGSLAAEVAKTATHSASPPSLSATTLKMAPCGSDAILPSESTSCEGIQNDDRNQTDAPSWRRVRDGVARSLRTTVAHHPASGAAGAEDTKCTLQSEAPADWVSPQCQGAGRVTLPEDRQTTISLRWSSSQRFVRLSSGSKRFRLFFEGTPAPVTGTLCDSCDEAATCVPFARSSTAEVDLLIGDTSVLRVDPIQGWQGQFAQLIFIPRD